jgi:nucleolar GTP-binding protein
MCRLPYVPTAQELIDKSFRIGAKSAKSFRSSKKPKRKEIRLLIAEERRVQAISKIICSDLKAIIKNFPSYEKLPKFYQKLLDIKVEKDKYKKSLGALQWCKKEVNKLAKRILKEIRKNKDPSLSREFLGRIASIIKQISPELENLIEIKKILREFPTIENLPTLVIAGYPNVGKSTFMRSLTGSKVKIESYPFTTQKILIGHKNFHYQKYQIIDTPGLLDRKIEKRNKSELQAILAIQELADKILFIFDPTQEIKAQEFLFNEIKEYFEKTEIFVVINKKDIIIAERGKIEEIKGKLKSFFPIEISAKSEEDCEEIFMRIFELKR